ncbi:hypothetical protein PT974_09069 [Cladobotryum mycophilum]|uniref:BTB domain-containing protein n=1 Tax=Cladobotryum mycophilum TaxID=491253 RepID=A0ABR0SG44_9HYPO
MVSIQQPNRFDRPLSRSSRSTFDKALPPRPKPSGLETTTILVGSKKRSFKVNRQLLCEISPFFRERLEDPFHAKTISLWLPSESASMFALFAEWVHSPSSFRDHLSNAVDMAHEKSEDAFEDIRWAIIHLHLFAAELSLLPLQDIAMDATQDLYLKYDWDVSPKLVTYLYTECEASPSMRLRRWAVAMVAFSLATGCELRGSTVDLVSTSPDQFRRLFRTLPEFSDDYSQHMESMGESGHDVRVKNPQLRISANELHNGQRIFGFRECSFHSHRAVVGESTCPNSAGRTSGRAMSDPDPPRPRWSLNKRWNGSLFSRNSENFDKRVSSITQSIANTFRGRGP